MDEIELMEFDTQNNLIILTDINGEKLAYPSDSILSFGKDGTLTIITNRD